MKNIFFFSLLIFFSCEDSINQEQNLNLTFISSEGTYGNNDGSISVFSDNQKIQTIENIGDVVQSILVNDNNLFAIINNSHIIKRYKITENGLSLPGIEISTNNSSPREMIILENKLYFTNWNSQDVKVLDLITYSIIASIPLNGIPEDIVTDGNHIWVSIPQLELYDPNNGSSVIKIDAIDNNIVETYEVGRGPEHMLINDNNLWISRTFYSSDWSSATYGSSVINLDTKEIKIMNYGAGLVCGGSILKLNDNIYRTVNGGVAPLTSELELNISAKIGDFNNLYSATSINGYIYLGVSDYFSPDTVYTHNEIGEEINTLIVNQALPGDFATWSID
ncbi:MAG: YncE family protein [Candidatus Neomarinimicrobiota bacterium]